MAMHSTVDVVTAGSALPESAAYLIEEVKGLVSPPAICATVLEMERSPNTSAQDFGAVISRDPSLTARLLRIVNSPYYGLRARVDTVSRAIAILGTRELCNLVVAVSAVATFTRLPNDLVNMDTFWRHSVFCGLIARKLAQHCKVLHPERLFVAGLLHDIGSLVVYHRDADSARRVLEAAQGDEDRLFRLEMQAYGFSHAEVGALLMDSWSLPPALCDAIDGHHAPAAAAFPLEAAIVHIADQLANRSDIGAFCENPAEVEDLDAATWALLGHAGDDLDVEMLIGDAGLEFTETVGLLTVSR